jgi:hypothetical protein
LARVVVVCSRALSRAASIALSSSRIALRSL